MPVTTSINGNAIPMSQLKNEQIGVIVGGMYSGHVVFRRTVGRDNSLYGFMTFSPKDHELIDCFGDGANHQVRVLQSGESFTVTIP